MFMLKASGSQIMARTLRVLQVHNYYRLRGGEDESFEAEVMLLRTRGVEVDTLSVHNDSIEERSRLGVAVGTAWSLQAARDMREKLQRFRPTVVHVHNLFPLLSPAVLAVASRAGIATVATLRNYRLGCINGLLFRDGRVCEDCLGKTVPIDGLKHRCYRGSLPESAVAVAAIGLHKALRLYQRYVSTFVTLTEFARDKAVEIGLPEDRIVVKPNFLEQDRLQGNGEGGYALFVGRLSEEKGVKWLLEAWRRLPMARTLVLIGSGPLNNFVSSICAERENIRWLGQLGPESVQEWIAGAKCVIVPSIWYETFGRVVMEAFAASSPVISSDIGALAELVTNGVNGFKVKPGSVDELVGAIDGMYGQSDAQYGAMREAARREFLTRFSADANFERLMDIYQIAVARASNA